MTTTMKRKPAAKKAGSKKATTKKKSAKKKSAKKTATKKKTSKKAPAKKSAAKKTTKKNASTKKATAKKKVVKKATTKKKAPAKKVATTETLDHQPSLIHEALDTAWPSTMAELAVQPNSTEEPSFESLVGTHSSDPEAAVVVVRPTGKERRPGLLTRVCHRLLELFGGRWPER